MASSEFEVSAEVAIPEVFGTKAAFKARFARSWTSRSERVLTGAVEASGLAPETLVEAILSKDVPSDLLHRALVRATEVSDPEYLTSLGRVLAAALDDAIVDEVGYLTAALIRLEPLQLRLLLLAFVWLEVQADPDDPELDATFPRKVPREEATHFALGQLEVAAAATSQKLSNALVLAALDEVASAGFLYDTTPLPHSPAGLPLYVHRVRESLWTPTDWGVRAVQLAFPTLGVWSPDPMN